MSSQSTSVLAIDGRLYRAWRRWYELILLGVGWWLLSLPVVTAPVATDWLLRAVDRTGRGEPLPGIADTLTQIRGRWAPTSRLALVHLGVLTLILVALLGPNPGGVHGATVLSVAVGVAATWALILPWTLVRQSASASLAGSPGVRGTITGAYRLALTRLPTSVLAATLTGACLLAPFALPKMIMLPALLTTPGLWAALLVRICGPLDLTEPTTDDRNSE